jgi:fructan beta-fructosidase
VPLQDGQLKIRLLADKSIVEVFAQDGEQAITEWVFPAQNEGRISISAEGGKVQLNKLSVHAIH